MRTSLAPTTAESTLLAWFDCHRIHLPGDPAGFAIFSMRLVPDAGGWRIVEVNVDRLGAQRLGTDDAEDAWWFAASITHRLVEHPRDPLRQRTD